MARPIWTGVISFGLVSVPVAIYSATQAHEVSFHQFETGTTDRIRYQRVNERTGEDVDFAKIAKGADVGGGKYVMISSDELDAIAPGRSRSLEIQAFVSLDEIDPIFYQKTYFLAPANDEATKTYALLRDAMASTKRAAIATLVMRGKEYLAAIRPDDDLLVLETMFFADEVRDAHEELDRLPGRMRLRPAELTMAEQLIGSMTGEWRPDDYRDTYTDRVHELIEAKKNGAEVNVAEVAPQATNVVDLMDVLRRSVAAAQGRTDGARKAAAPTTKRARAKRTGARSGAQDLASLSKADLAAEARKLAVPGRSSMSRAELATAVADARGKPRRAS
jgi:DNA end-binding protein Ku